MLLASGYIAGGTLCGLIIAFFTFLPYGFNRVIDISHPLGSAHVFQNDPDKIEEAKKAVDEARTKGEAEEAKEEKAIQNAKTDEEKAKAVLAKAERVEEKQKAIDGVNSEFWLESGAAKILSMLAFALLCGFLFWQGLQKPPKETPDALPPHRRRRRGRKQASNQGHDFALVPNVCWDLCVPGSQTPFGNPIRETPFHGPGNREWRCC